MKAARAATCPLPSRNAGSFMQGPTSGELWNRYVDWCSARVAGRFLELSAEQIWELAQRGGREAPAGGEGPPPPPYLELVRQVTLELFSQMGLPPFAEWEAAYRTDPRPYDEEILGYRDAREVPLPQVSGNG